MPKLNQLFSSEDTNQSYGVQGVRPPLTKKSSYQIYALSKFNELKEAVFQAKQKDKARFRFLIDTQDKLWFAREGTPGNLIPAHYQITGTLRPLARCRAAGTLTIQGDQLVSIDHKSGDFRPSFSSIQRLLRIFAQTEALPFVIKDFTIIELDDGGRQLVFHDIKQADFEAWSADQPHGSEQPDEVKEVCYEAQNKRRFALSPSQFRGALFFNSDADSAQHPRDQSLQGGRSLFDSDSETEDASAAASNPIRTLFQSSENNAAAAGNTAEHQVEREERSSKRSRFI